MKIKTTKDKVIFTFDRYGDRICPWTNDKVGEHPIFTGLIFIDKDGNEELGFAHTIDMSYKGKPDQVGEFIVRWYGEEKDFLKECGKMGISVTQMDMRGYMNG